MNKQQEPMITILYQDWLEEFIANEPDVSDEDAIIRELKEKGHKSAEVARFTIVARERGEAPENILPPNKLLLMAGARLSIAGISRRKVAVQIEDKILNIRELVAVPREEGEPDSDEAASHQPPERAQQWVGYTDERALDGAEYYLLNTLNGHIWSRLVILAAGKRDFELIADKLMVQIQAMVDTLK